MSLFGFLKKDCGYYLNKGDKFFDREDFYNALVNYSKAVEICEKDNIDGIKAKIAVCREKLALKNIELAKAYFDAEDFDEAVGFAETALEYADTDELKNQANELIEKIEKMELEYSYGGKRETVFEDVEDDEYYEIISGSYPDFIKKEIDGNEELKKITVELNRGNLESAEKIEQYPSSPAADYLKALFFSLKEDYEKAYSLFSELFEKYGNSFTSAMHCEYLELIRRLEKDSSEVDRVLEVAGGMLDPVKLAASIFLERGELDKSEAMVDYGFELMDKLNPDTDLIATAGILYYKKENYRKCVDFLGSLKDMYARQGYFAFPSVMAVPLAMSYYKLGKYNDGLELLLHLLKSEKDPEVLKIAQTISEKSDREDLKKQLKYLVRE